MTSPAKLRDPRPSSAIGVGLGAAAILCIGLLLRLRGAQGDLWLDEILALNLANQVSSALGVFTQLHQEINHHLYTFYLAWVGPEQSSLVYRLPSLVAGLGTVVMAGLIGRRRGQAELLLAMALVAASYLLVLYSGEARGYAAAVFFAFLCFWLLEKHLVTGNRLTGLLFSLGAICGLASQASFLSFYLAALAWSVVRWIRIGLRTRSFTLNALCCHGPAMVFLLVLYWIDLRRLINLGGTESRSILESYSAALAWALAAPGGSGWHWVAAVLAGGILVAGCMLLTREKSDAWVFFVGAIVVFPLALVLARGSMVIYVRYFIIGLAFLLMLASYGLATLWRRGGRYRGLCIALLLTYLAANGWRMAELFAYGRGQYRAAIGFISQHSAASPVIIAGDQDFRISTVLAFYAPKAMLPKFGQYVPQGAWPATGPEWLIWQKESFDPPIPPRDQLQDRNGNRYDCVKTFPSAPLCGLHWFLYHNQLKKTGPE